VLRTDSHDLVIVSIHQPHFLPWGGYMNKLMRSDVFVWLDSVQYRKNYFQNRTEIRTHRGERAWLTLPVRAPFGSRIDQVVVADPSWRESVRQRVEQEYHRAPYFRECWPPIAEALAREGDDLSGVNLRALKAVLGVLGVDGTRLVQIRDLSVSSEDPTARLVDACRAVGATRYIAGRGGRNYLSVDLFERAGIELIWQDFRPEAFIYPQKGDGFLPGLSVVDCLFQLGGAATRDLLMAQWSP
jgi:hypothetical protein